MVFITAGMGGGTGTGGAPIVAQVARRLGILTVAIVTKPFSCEGRQRTRSANEGIEMLRDNVDTLVVIPNERLLDVAEPTAKLTEAFSMADDVLYNATRGISDLITVHGLINLDFADVKTTMKNGGTALMGAATVSGEGRAERAAHEAISSPLLDGLSIHGARNVLVNITAGPSLGIREATAATSIIQKEAGDDAEVIFGTVIDETMGDDLRVTVIATGFEDAGTVKQPSRRTVPLDSVGTETRYKGERNLKTLDAPAYERRAPAEREEARPAARTGADPRDPQRPAVGGERPASPIRRVLLDEVQSRKERIRKDDADTPAFLRKMMD
jgi:cell division protein FtsZ